MGREVRRVPKDWQHPKREGRDYTPLHEGYAERLAEFSAKIQADGLKEAIEYFGGGPQEDDYMPDWPDSEKTHLQMYETCSEGTPISPVMDTPENLARWLADNGASAFGSMTATYEQWLEVCEGAWAPSAVLSHGVIESGVAAMSKKG